MPKAFIIINNDYTCFWLPDLMCIGEIFADTQPILEMSDFFIGLGIVQGYGQSVADLHQGVDQVVFLRLFIEK